MPLDECIADYDMKLRNALATAGHPHLVTLGMGDDGHIASWFPPMSAEEYTTSHSKNQLVFHTESTRWVLIAVTYLLHQIRGS